MRIDLHMHSCFSSDGEASPRDLVTMSTDAGMRYIAISDHNRADGVGPALDAARGSGLTVIPAIEIDCLFMGGGLHVLGYFIDHTDARYAELWNEVSRLESDASQEKLIRARGLGISFDVDAVLALAGDEGVTAEQIAEVALADPRNADSSLLAPYRPGGPRSDNPYVNFYWDHCSPGKAAYVPVSYRPLEEVVGLIVDTGGVPVLAHPGQSLRGCRDRLGGIVAAGVRGLEAYSSYHSGEECGYWVGCAGEYGLFVTCGSDYHGKTKPAIGIGQHGAGDGAVLMEALFSARDNNSKNKA